MKCRDSLLFDVLAFVDEFSVFLIGLYLTR